MVVLHLEQQLAQLHQLPVQPPVPHIQLPRPRPRAIVEAHLHTALPAHTLQPGGRVCLERERERGSISAVLGLLFKVVVERFRGKDARMHVRTYAHAHTHTASTTTVQDDVKECEEK